MSVQGKSTTPIRILVADDHELVRRGIVASLERNPQFQVIAEAVDGREALNFCRDLNPDVVVLDLSMPVMGGLEFLRELPRVCSGPRVVVLSMQGAEPIVQSALAAGARGYVLKSDAARDLAAAVLAVAEGRMFFTTSIATAMVAAYTGGASQLRAEPPSPLTPRETQILRFVAKGKSNKEIAAQLGISIRTVETHRGNILEKLDLHSVSDLVLYAVRTGLCDPEPAEPGPWKPNADPPPTLQL